uniref:NADH-ubiquinone oxidoreductase chain 2 n=1 Tax=Neoperlops gressitti TaxID=2684670 RepID=A0A6B9PUJ2_9NEOP|nr:NADH dehydrogenase subunit 2 [Neoperlops gressitti]
MINNPSKMLFLLILLFSSIVSISSTSWFGAWIGLEINLLSFIPLLTASANSLSTEASLKYFLTQALASANLLLAVIMVSFLFANPASLVLWNPFLSTLISSSLLLKMGAAPFHFWFPGVMEGLTWINGLILMTWQKIAPLMLLSYNLSFSMFWVIIIMSSITIGSLGGLTQTSLRKILAYSSINHLGWLIPALIFSESVFNTYFAIYFLLTATIVLNFYTFNVSHLNQLFALNQPSPWLKVLLFCSLLSLGGLPPFLGFLPKWLIIQNLTDMNMTILVFSMIVMTLITLFYYLRLTFSAFMLSYTEISWKTLPTTNTPPYFMTWLLTITSTLGLLIISLIYHIL